MKEISSKRLKELETEVKKEFPENYGLQQIHLARLIIEEKTKDMSSDKLIEYYREHAGIVKKRGCIEQKSPKKGERSRSPGTFKRMQDIPGKGS